MNDFEPFDFLKSNQPMPADDEITQQECDSFLSCIDYFKSSVDDKCIPLFINSVGPNTGMGMYESIKDVLIFQDREKVTTHLIHALKTSSEAVKFRCCWWATDLDLWDLDEIIWPMIKSLDQDLSEAARYYIKLKNELG